MGFAICPLIKDPYLHKLTLLYSMSLTASLSDALPGTSSNPSAKTKTGHESPDSAEHQSDEISTQLESCESAVQQYRDSKLKAARAMRIIGNEELYCERGFETIEEYARAQFDFSKQRWYQLTDYATVHDALKQKIESTEVDLPLPENESQARPLSEFKANADQLFEVWKAVVDRCDSLTRKNIGSAVSKLTGEEESEEAGEPSGDDDSQKGPDQSSPERNPGGGDESSQEANPDPNSSSSGDEEGDTQASNDGSSGDDSDKGDKLAPQVPPGFFLSISTAAAESAGIVSDTEKDRLLISGDELTEKELKTAVFKEQPKSDALAPTSAEPGIGDVNFSPLLPSRTTFSGRISEEPAPQRAIFRAERIGQIQSGQSRGERALICPQVDLFADIVPDVVIELILSSLKGAELTPILCTTHLDRAQGFSLPDSLWLGTRAARSTLQDANQKLGTFSGPAVKWLLYDVSKEDRENGLPSSPENADWIVFDPPQGAGVSLELGEANQLQEDAQSAGAASSFRRPFKAFSTDYPNP